jgi:hypothetical protein
MTATFEPKVFFIDKSLPKPIVKKDNKTYKDAWALLDFKLRRIFEKNGDDIKISKVLTMMGKLEGKTR